MHQGSYGCRTGAARGCCIAEAMQRLGGTTLLRCVASASAPLTQQDTWLPVFSSLDSLCSLHAVSCSYPQFTRAPCQHTQTTAVMRHRCNCIPFWHRSLGQRLPLFSLALFSICNSFVILHGLYVVVVALTPQTLAMLQCPLTTSAGQVIDNQVHVRHGTQGGEA